MDDVWLFAFINVMIVYCRLEARDDTLLRHRTTLGKWTDSGAGALGPWSSWTVSMAGQFCGNVLYRKWCFDFYCQHT
jgi:hypothetical protein